MFDKKTAEKIAEAIKDKIVHSEYEGKEISGIVCLSKDGDVLSVTIDRVGDAKHTELTKGRLCDKDVVQISFHTHPTSGGGCPDFSSTDKETIIERFEKGSDDGSCVGSIYGITCKFFKKQ